MKSTTSSELTSGADFQVEIAEQRVLGFSPLQSPEKIRGLIVRYKLDERPVIAVSGEVKPGDPSQITVAGRPYRVASPRVVPLALKFE